MHIHRSKPFALTLTLALALSPGLVASAFAAPGIAIGGGLNSSFTDSDGEGVEYSNRIGFNLGVGFEAEILPALFIVPELNLETRGETGEEGPPFQFKGRMKLLYLQAPVLFMAKLPLGVAILEAYAGPSFGVLLSGKMEFEMESGMEFELEDAEGTVDIKKFLNPVDLGLEAGVGIGTSLGPVDVFIRPSYYHGLTNVDNGETQGQSPFYLRSFKLKAGIRIPL